MMESTLLTNGAGGSAVDDPLFSDDAPTAAGSGGVGGGGGVDLMSSLLGEDPAGARPSGSMAASGLLGDPAAASSPSSPSLFGGGPGGGGGGDGGLFGAVDAEEQEAERRRVQAEKQRQLAEEEEEERRRRAEEEASRDFDGAGMQDLSLDGAGNDYGMGMGMGLGGHIPQVEAARPPSSPPRAAPPVPQQAPQPQGVMNTMAGSVYSTSGGGQLSSAATPAANGGARQQQQQQQSQQPSVLAGMHVGSSTPVHLGGIAAPGGGSPLRQHSSGLSSFPSPPPALAGYVPPPPFDPLFGRVVVNDPMLIQGTGLFAGPPHWTYLVTVHAKGGSHQLQPVSAVRRRFRHFVALEDRLRTGVPGAILPPRPEKHPARAIEEATARQSADFAGQRAAELSVYMNSLVSHPHTGTSPELKLFLTLQDHIGTAWPEVSSSAFTRMTAVGSATVEKLTDTMDGVLSELGTAQQVAAGEDSAEILALAAYEGRRIGAVTSSVPKIEGAVSLIRERGERSGAAGLEMSKLAKDVAWCDRDLSAPMEVLSAALLRSGRRTKRLGLELAAAVSPFVTQYRTCRYEQMAFADRRSALKRRTEARSKADGKAARLMMNQTSMQHMGRLGQLERMEGEAAMYDEFATETGREADEIAARLQSEVGRVGAVRVREWDSAMKVVAGSMKEACSENASIWETALERFRQELGPLDNVRGV